MPESLRLLGSQVSPYSLKLRSYFRFKQIPFEWIERGFSNNALFSKHAKVQLIPLLLLPSGEALQDSTPIIDRYEAEYPDRSIHPPEAAARFLSELLEEFGDEWCNKLMFQYRWGPQADCDSAAGRLVDLMFPKILVRIMRPLMVRMLVRRMKPRMSFAGANEMNRPHLEASWSRTVELLEAHLSSRLYLFGGRPSFGDFGIWGNFNQAYSDPTCHAHIEASAPAVAGWIERMHDPKIEADFEPLSALLPTLEPLLEEQVADRFLAWSVANAVAWDAQEPLTRLEFGGVAYEQKTFKYHAWSLAELKKKLEAVRDDPELREVLEQTGCAAYLL